MLLDAPDRAMQVLGGTLELNAADKMLRKGKGAVKAVRQTAPATGEAGADRTGEHSQPSRPSGERHPKRLESTSEGESPAAGEARTTREENASDAMSAPSGERSSLSAHTATVTETTRRSEAPGRSPELKTPPLLLACLRTTLGDSDLHPCSSGTAKDSIAAGERCSAEQDGLSLPWHGTVHVFPPINRVGEFADKLLAELASGRVRKASFLGPADSTG